MCIAMKSHQHFYEWISIQIQNQIQPTNENVTFVLSEWIGQFKWKWTHAYQCPSSNQKFKNWENTKGIREQTI